MRLYTRKETAQIMKIGLRTLDRRLATGQLRCFRLGKRLTEWNSSNNERHGRQSETQMAPRQGVGIGKTRQKDLAQ